MFKFIKVTGNSLFPEYQEGDYVILITAPFFSFKWGNVFRLKEGDTVVFQHPTYGIMIKNIESVSSDKIQVVGTHPNSVDSRRFGPIDRANVIGKVIWHIKKS